MNSVFCVDKAMVFSGSVTYVTVSMKTLELHITYSHINKCKHHISSIALHQYIAGSLASLSL